MACMVMVLVLSLSSEITGSHEMSELRRVIGIDDELDVSTVKQFRGGDVLIGAALPITNQDGYGRCSSGLTIHGVQAVETINMLVDRVNNDPSILRGVKIGTIMIDTCYSDSHALRRVLAEIIPLFFTLGHDECKSISLANNNSTPVFAGMLGAVSSGVTIQIAKLLQVFSVPLISHWSTSHEFSDKTRFKYFFRTVPPDSYQASAMINLIKHMGWNYISVFYEDSVYGQSGFQEIQEHAELNSVCIALSHAIKSDVSDDDLRTLADHLLKKKKAKAVIIFASYTLAEKLIRNVHTMSNKSDIIWIGSDGWATELPRISDDDSYLDSLEGAITFSPQMGHVKGLDEYMTKITLEDHEKDPSRNPWFAQYLALQNNCSLNGSYSFRQCDQDEHLNPATFRSYDLALQNLAKAMLSFVYALDAYHQDACNGKAGLCDAITPMAGTAQLASQLYSYLKNVSFTENGGTFRFDEKQDGLPVYSIFVYGSGETGSPLNYRKGWVHAGTYFDQEIIWFNESPVKARNTSSVCSKPCAVGEARIQEQETCCWYCQPCYDHEYVSSNFSSCLTCPAGERTNEEKDGCEALPIQQMNEFTAYVAISIVLGSLGILSTLVISVIFITYRHTAIVKASGRELCFFVLVGVIMTFSNCFPITSDTSMTSCIASRLLLCIGPTCMYAGLLTKTIRVVIIFRSKNALSTKTKLFLQPRVQLCVTSCIVLVQLFVLIGWFVITPPRPEVVHPTSEVAFLTCPRLVEIWIIVGVLYPFLLIVVCTILATINRQVPTGFNETTFIGFTMYTTCIIWLAFLSIFFTNSTNLPEKLLTVSVCLSLSAATVLCCLFIPRCYTIVFHPKKNTVKSVMTNRVRLTHIICNDAAVRSPTDVPGINAELCPNTVMYILFN